MKKKMSPETELAIGMAIVCIMSAALWRAVLSYFS